MFAVTATSFSSDDPLSGLTLGEVVEIEPTYIDWIVRTIDRDPEISIAARVIMRHLTGGRVRRPRLDTFVPRS